MKCWGGAWLVVGMVWLSAGMVQGQEAAPALSNTQTMPQTLPGKVYEVGANVSAPELVPQEWALATGDTCNDSVDGVVMLLLVVDATGAPQDVTIANAQGAVLQGSALQRLALRIVSADHFKPATLNANPVAVSQWAEVSITGCIATKMDDGGNSTQVFGLTEQPVQRFGPLPAPKGSAKSGVGEAAGGSLYFYRVGDGVSPPIARNTVKAEFPNDGRKRSYGVCLVSTIVDVDGKPRNPRVVHSAGTELDQKAVEALNKYQFTPSMLKGKAVPVQITVEVNFNP